MAKQTFSVKKLAPYKVTETVYKAKKTPDGKHLSWEREDKVREVKDGRLVMFITGHSVRIEGGDEAVRRLMVAPNEHVRPEVREVKLTPEQAVERVLSRVAVVEEDE
jgi:hypothetical protein